MLVTLSVEGRGAAAFFQVLVVEASDVASAHRKAIASYAELGLSVVSFDESETAVLDPATVTLPAPRTPAAGIIAASERFWVAPAPSAWRLPVRARAALLMAAWALGALGLGIADDAYGWPFAFLIPVWMVVIAIGTLFVRCEHCGKSPLYKRVWGLPMSNPFFSSTCSTCNEPLDLRARPGASEPPANIPARRSRHPYRSKAP